MTYGKGFSFDPIAFVKGVYDQLSAGRMAFGTDTHLQNSVDEICSLLASTLYKLKNLA